MVELSLGFDLYNTSVLYKTAGRKNSPFFQSDFPRRKKIKYHARMMIT